MNWFLELLFGKRKVKEVWFNAKFDEKAIVIWEYDSFHCWVQRNEGRTFQHPSTLESLTKHGWVKI